MKLPATLLLAIGCAAATGCQGALAGGVAAPVIAQPVAATVTTVGEEDGEAPVRTESVAESIPEVTALGEPGEPKGWDCPPCGRG